MRYLIWLIHKRKNYWGNMEFIAEIKQVKLVKKSSLDNEYQVLFLTDNSNVMDLGKLAYDTAFKVKVEVIND